MNRSVWNFYPISGPRAFEEVVDQITFAIRTGAFKPGDRLPLVEELALAMKVSKPTIGEAIKVLSRAGVLVAQRGASGGLTVVSDTIPETLTMRRPSGWREATLRELIEARRPIEMQIVMLAAERATPEDFEALRYAVNQLKAQSSLHTMQRLHFENLFHYNLGRAARSELLSFYQHQILEQITLLLRDHFPQTVDVATSAGHHERMLNAMERGDRKALMAMADEHLGLVESIAAAQERASARPERRALA